MEPFTIFFEASALRDLEQVDRKYLSLIRRTIDEQLHYEPLIQTRNRKPLVHEIWPGASWELRFGPGNRFRVFYDVDEQDRRIVIIAIGVKIGSRLRVGGKEVQL